jgi:hypothetical protein
MIKNTQITEHFTMSEVCKTNKNLENIPTPLQMVNIQSLLNNVLEPIRNQFNTPITCSSIFRSNAVNNAVGGVKTSHHLCNNGYVACDIKIVEGHKLSEVYEYIKDNLEFCELIWEKGNDEEPAWIHVSYNINPKYNVKEILRTK